MGSDEDRTRQDRLSEDHVSQPTPSSPPEPAPTVEAKTNPASVPPASAGKADEAAREVARDTEARTNPSDPTIVSANSEAVPGELDSDHLASSELGPEAELDSQETTCFAPQVAAQQAAREFNKDRKKKWTQIGRYEIERELGAGAFGKVFLGRDQHLDRLVAVKVAKAGAIHTGEDKQRFLREARAAAQLRHPHIIPVYEYGEHEETNYIAYEFIPGTTLRHVLRQRPKMSTREATALMIKIASALHYAHERGIVHRDVKPENVLIDDANEPHVADFGCARQDDTNVLLTLEGVVMGTPAYMSPEQASGASHRADARSDVWSLGVILNELLTGERPFKGNITEILLSIRSREPRSIRQLDSTLPKDLETIVQKCMAKDPHQRFQTAGELVDELERWERGEPIQSRPINLFARTARWARRNPQVAALLSLVVFTFALGAGLSSYFLWNFVQQRDKNTLQLVDRLKTAQPPTVLAIIDALETAPNRQPVVDELHERWRDSKKPPRKQNESGDSARYGLALVSLEPDRFRHEILPDLQERLLQESPQEFRALRDGLVAEAAWFTREPDGLWDAAENVHELESRRIRAHAALALFQPESERWPSCAEDMVELVLSDEFRSEWLDALVPVRAHLRSPLQRYFESGRDSQGAASAAIAQLFGQDDKLMTNLIRIATPAQLKYLLTPLNQGNLPHIDAHLRSIVFPATTVPAEYDERVHAAAAGTANLLIAKFKLGQPQDLLDQLDQDRQPDVRSEIIERLAFADIDPQMIKKSISELREGKQSARLMAMLLAFGEFSLLQMQREALKPEVLAIYREQRDSGVHSAAEWLLQSWGFDDVLETEKKSFAGDDSSTRNWSVLPTGQMMVALGPVDSFQMGSTDFEQARFNLTENIDGELRHRRRIGRRFEIAAREVTAEDFTLFLTETVEMLEEEQSKIRDDRVKSEELQIAADKYQGLLENVKELNPEHPVQEITWGDAIAYCRWLSEKDGVEEKEQCYQSILELTSQEAFAQPEDDREIVQRTGFRLPTTGEWEYACRALAETAWPQGDSPEHLGAYAWIGQPEGKNVQAPGTLKPNRFGLYDMLGNVSEWCHCLSGPYPSDQEVVSDPYWEAGLKVREYRGGDLETFADQARPAMRWNDWPDAVIRLHGFRVARTIEVVDDM